MEKTVSRGFKIEAGIVVSFSDGTLTAQGSQGELSLKIPGGLKVSLNEERVALFQEREKKKVFGLYGALIKDLLEGVARGFRKELELVGVGFKVKKSGDKLELNLGFSHPTFFAVPEGVSVEVKDETHLSVIGPSRELVGQTAARLRDLKRPEPYKGKGIRFVGEVVRRKAGKAAKAAVATK